MIESRVITLDLAGNVSGTEADETWAHEFLRALGYLLLQSNMLEQTLHDLYWIVSNKPWEQVHEDVRGKTLGPLRTWSSKS